jgi:hypothetical protein
MGGHDGFGAVDLVNTFARAAGGALGDGAGPRFPGRTNFEGHRLDEMLDLVEPTAPEQVEEVGTSLIEAGEAIAATAELLGKDVLRVDWEGVSGATFRTWSAHLIDQAAALADYAKAIGEQVLLAGAGLASVRKAMPPRDGREDARSIHRIPEAERVAGNAVYVAAIKAERDRQEAINQMIRLASFYAVAEQALAVREPPAFPSMPRVGVPEPHAEPAPWRSGSSADVPTGGRPGQASVSTAAPSAEPPVYGRAGGPGVEAAANPLYIPAGNGSMQIDSVATVAPQDAARPLALAQAPGAGPSTTGTPAAVSAGTPVPVSPLAGAALAGRGSAPGQGPVRDQGRGHGRGQVPRAATGAGSAAGQAAGRAPVPSMGPTGQPAVPHHSALVAGGPAAGGIPGGVHPLHGGVPTGSGVVGGRPAATPSSPGAARLSRGTVIGEETGAARRTTGKPRHRDVVGLPSPSAAQGKPSTSVSNRQPGEPGNTSAAHIR